MRRVSDIQMTITSGKALCSHIWLKVHVITGTQSLIRNPWDQTRFGNRNFSDFGIIVRGIRGQELSESIAQLIGTNW
jgi:hypothetical protein